MKDYVVRDESNKAVLPSQSELLTRLLANRGIFDEISATSFLTPDYDQHLHDPFLLSGMAKAVKRILQAIDKDERVVIFSDYDADGIPGAVALHDFFKKIGFTNFTNYIPHRHDEGFGLNPEAVNQFEAEGVKLLITIDCGITDVPEVDLAVRHGIDVIITDHHLPGDTLPQACAIVNPKQKSCGYPFDALCGSGVIYKLIQAILSKRDFGLKPGMEKWWLDMVGLATLSDMVSLTGENRVLAHYGLKVLRKSPRPGLAQLLKELKIDQRYLTEDDIGFMIAPRINAASRMGVPRDAFDLLATDDEKQAGVLAKHLNKINDERKGVVAAIVKDAKKHLSGREIAGNLGPVIVVGNPKWRPTLAGLVANTLSEEYRRPVFVWGRDGADVLKGSCRTYNGINLVKLMDGAKKLFTDYGGHQMSGGFALSQDKVHELESKLIEQYEKGVATDDELSWVDAELTLSDVNWQTFNELDQLAPFGVGNPKPQFLFPEITISNVKKFGRDGAHLELEFSLPAQKSIKAIKFFAGPEGDEYQAGQKINLVAALEKSMFRRFPELRLRIIDILG